MRVRLSRLRSLTAQLIALLTLALLPLGLISLYQTQAVLREVRTVNRASLMERTVAAATLERELIQEALGAAQGLSAVVLASNDNTCSSAMREFVSANPKFIFAGFIDTKGMMACQSTGGPRDFGRSDALVNILSRPEPTISISEKGLVTGQPVILINHPVLSRDEPIGVVSISIPHRFAESLMPEDGMEEGLQLATINAAGMIIAASDDREIAAMHLPRGIPQDALFASIGQTFVAQSEVGDTRIYAISQMIPGSVVLVGSRPVSVALERRWELQALLPLMFPVLMWIAGVGVAYFGVQRLVIRHMTALRRAMRQYALGKLKGGQLEFQNPPEELRDTERAFNQMVLLLSRADAKQEQDLRDKEVLLREVHHRVKNNLQLIASIMNMQARTARTPETRRMLAGLQRRVRGLAMLHRTLYTSPEMTTVDVAQLIEAMVKDIIGVVDISDLSVETDLASVDLYPDQAVPLSMFLSEAVTNAVKYVGTPEGGAARISVRLDTPEDTQVRLRIENTLGKQLIVGEEEQPVGDGLGSRLMRAFVSQLEGHSEVHETDGLYVLEVKFQRRDFEIGSVPQAA